MKKFISLCFFALALMLGTQTADAQDKIKMMEEQVKVESQELTKLLGLDENQSAMVWRALMVKEKATMEMAHKGVSDASKKAQLQDKIDMNFKSMMLDVLSEEQFVQYSKYISEQKSKE